MYVCVCVCVCLSVLKLKGSFQNKKMSIMPKKHCLITTTVNLLLHVKSVKFLS